MLQLVVETRQHQAMILTVSSHMEGSQCLRQAEACRTNSSSGRSCVGSGGSQDVVEDSSDETLDSSLHLAVLQLEPARVRASGHK
jgi:hypothetical protein